MDKKIFTLIIGVAVLCMPLYARSNADSLITVLKTQNSSVQAKMDACMSLCDMFRNSDIDKMFQYAQEGELFAKKTANKETIAEFLNLQSRYYAIKGDYDKAFELNQKALTSAVDGKALMLQSGIINDMAVNFLRQSKYQQGLDYLLKSLSVLDSIEKSGSKNIAEKDFATMGVKKAGRLLNIANVYLDLQNKEQGLYYLKQVEKMVNNKKVINLSRTTDKKDIAHYKNIETGTLQSFYAAFGSYYYDVNRNDSALIYTLKADSIADITGNKFAKMSILDNLTGIYIREYNSEKALKYAKEHLQIAEEIGDKRGTISALTTLSQIYSNMNMGREASETAIRAYEMDSTNIELAFMSSYRAAMANIITGNADLATRFLLKFRDISNLRNEKNMQNSLNEMQTKYETEEKVMQIAALEKEKTYFVRLSLAGLIILALALVAATLYFIFRKQKEKLMRKERILQASEAVHNGENEERKRIARDLHDGLGGMLQSIRMNLDNAEHLENARQLLIKSIEELRRISHNLMPASLQYGIKPALEEVCHSVPNTNFYYFGNNEPLNEQTNLLLYRCAYELINNSLKYAEATNINVQLCQTAENITLTVADNGCGFDTNLKTKGAGLKNIRDRVAVAGGKIEINSQKGSGTETVIELETAPDNNSK
ncbi:MAG: sensor histidine kinase [Prevotellaceae bacterium]|jgi:signal transduction histidine kinase|nr:sensor histidine kinase [Prevotellaceae bacterium]